MTPVEFEHIAKGIRPKLMQIARGFLSVTDLSSDSEDIVQEALITLWQLTQKGYEINSYEALGVKITKNICVAHYRRSRIKTQAIQNDNYPGGMSATEDAEKSDSRRIRTCLMQELTDTQRKLIQMRNDEGLSLDEIAKITGKPKTSIKTTISAARSKMMTRLQKLI